MKIDKTTLAAKNGLIKKSGYRKVTNPKAHNAIATCWVVNIRKEWN